MQTKKQLRERLNEMILENELNDILIDAYKDKVRNLKDKNQDLDVHNYNLKSDLNQVNVKLHEKTEEVNDVVALLLRESVDNIAHTKFISAQAEYIEHLMKR